MIEIHNPEECCGCSACAQACPQQCILMKADSEGFVYPIVQKDMCVDCGLCQRVCPMINKATASKPLKVFAAKNKNEEIRRQSSSGGMFTALAEQVIQQGGVVFGATYDAQWNVIHSYTETIKGLQAFRGSKYVQSNVEHAYVDVKNFLLTGRQVLFSGTPCQIAGLNGFLRKSYSNLITVEILCHGVPSPKVWQRYLEEKKKTYQNNAISAINFRDKKNGWSNYDIKITFQNGAVYQCLHKKDPFFRGFLQNLYLRPSCYACQCKNGRSCSDLILADYWNINQVAPEYNDQKGVSLVLINTSKAELLWTSIKNQIDAFETDYDEGIQRNGGFAEYLAVPKERMLFYRLFNEGKYCFPRRKTLWDKIIQWLKQLV